MCGIAQAARYGSALIEANRTVAPAMVIISPHFEIGAARKTKPKKLTKDATIRQIKDGRLLANFRSKFSLIDRKIDGGL